MRGITDMHCHVLPGLDDGPKDMADSMAILKEAYRQGIRTMIVTPHYHPGRYVAQASSVLETIARVREAMEAEGIRIQLIPGQECYYFSGLLDELEAGRALTLANSNHVLVEYEPYTGYTVIRGSVRTLRNQGYTPIVAHFERYSCLRGAQERLEELREDGAMLQLNFDRLLEPENLIRRNPWRRLLKKGLVDFLGSDTHGMSFRPLHVKEAVKWMRGGLPVEIQERVLYGNIQELLSKYS